MRTTIQLVTLVFLGCASAPARPSSSPPARDAPVLPPEISAPGATILLGEFHGTRELPAFVGGLVAQLAAVHPVILGLELPAERVPSLDAYLANDGGPAAREAALRDPWWTIPYQDGRESVAMFALIEAMRALRAGGARVEVVCFDPGGHAGEHPDARDEGMAQRLLARRRARPDATLVAYAGNNHVRRAAFAHMAGRAWMGMFLARAGVAFVTLNQRFADGSAWTCIDGDASHCGARFVPGNGDERGIHFERSADGAYDGWYGVGPITASPPVARPELAVDFDARLAALRDAQPWRSRSRRAYDAKQYAQCAAELDHAEATAEDAYVQACCFALAGDKEAAFARLALAIERGFRSFRSAEQDTDLASLHGDPRWPPRAPQ
jgi:hypothetical protein